MFIFLLHFVGTFFYIFLPYVHVPDCIYRYDRHIWQHVCIINVSCLVHKSGIVCVDELELRVYSCWWCVVTLIKHYVLVFLCDHCVRSGTKMERLKPPNEMDFSTTDGISIAEKRRRLWGVITAIIRHALAFRIRVAPSRIRVAPSRIRVAPSRIRVVPSCIRVVPSRIRVVPSRIWVVPSRYSSVTVR